MTDFKFFMTLRMSVILLTVFREYVGIFNITFSLNESKCITKKQIYGIVVLHFRLDERMYEIYCISVSKS